eukprot:maker-scaffold133_size323035-snap-gene-2.28 protein:Tk02246 transcript:maker-scaffold133_size323035-snap-gene-2.28-mRNA-1 annotation:"GJ18730"
MDDHPILTKAKLLTILKEYEGIEDVQLAKAEVKVGSEAGQNYSGQVLECNLEANVAGASKSYHWMAKLPLEDPHKFAWSRCCLMEEKEIRYYDYLAPNYKELMVKRGAKFDFNPCPVVFSEFDPNCPNEEAQKGSLLKVINDSMGSGLKIILSACGEEFAKSYQGFLDEGKCPMKLKDQLFEPSQYPFTTLCHGDAWFNNMLFKYEGSEAIQVCLLDLAIIRWVSPATDLVYFMFLSTTPEFRKQHTQEMLEFYQGKLSEYLKHLGENGSLYSIDQVTTDYEKCKFIGGLMALMILPYVLADTKNAIGADEVKGDFTKEDDMKKIMEEVGSRIKGILESEPHIADRIKGAFLEVAETGVFKIAMSSLVKERVDFLFLARPKTEKMLPKSPMMEMTVSRTPSTMKVNMGISEGPMAVMGTSFPSSDKWRLELSSRRKDKFMVCAWNNHPSLGRRPSVEQISQT